VGQARGHCKGEKGSGMARQVINAECGDCRATGLYSGVCEPKGTAVICVRCGGTGCEALSYTPFTVRRRRGGIQTISRSRGAFILTGVGRIGDEMTYSQFEERIPSGR